MAATAKSAALQGTYEGYCHESIWSPKQFGSKNIHNVQFSAFIAKSQMPNTDGMNPTFILLYISISLI